MKDIKIATVKHALAFVVGLAFVAAIPERGRADQLSCLAAISAFEEIAKADFDFLLDVTSVGQFQDSNDRAEICSPENLDTADRVRDYFKKSDALLERARTLCANDQEKLASLDKLNKLRPDRPDGEDKRQWCGAGQ